MIYEPKPDFKMQVKTDGKTYQVDFFNLDVIISVGYRVKSAQGTRFRQWATRMLNQNGDSAKLSRFAARNEPRNRLTHYPRFEDLK